MNSFFLNMKLGRGVINNHNFESSILEFKYDRNASYLIQNVPCIMYISKIKNSFLT